VPVWSAEVVVDEGLARQLLAQFPELRLESLRPLAEGWDNAVWVVDEQYAFRFPRRQIAIPGVELELAVLPKLAPLLPLPIPEPIFRGRPTEDYPWPFFGSELLPGRETCGAQLDDEARLEVALQLAGFLRTLHNVDLDEALPVDANSRADMTRRVPLARRDLGELERLGVWRAPATVGGILEAAERLPPAKTPAVVHGDLHFRHVLVEDSRVTGVIDWGDLCRSDPAIDLQLLWSFLPLQARPAFLDAYGPVSEEQLLRARVLAFSVCAALALYAHAEDAPNVKREALAGLVRALDERPRI
jgi:aminoglycoside phosphotransferase (APT) family kinase protein